MHNYVNIVYSYFLFVSITTCIVDFVFDKEGNDGSGDCIIYKWFKASAGFDIYK